MEWEGRRLLRTKSSRKKFKEEEGEEGKTSALWLAISDRTPIAFIQSLVGYGFASTCSGHATNAPEP